MPNGRLREGIDRARRQYAHRFYEVSALMPVAGGVEPVSMAFYRGCAGPRPLYAYQTPVRRSRLTQLR